MREHPSGERAPEADSTAAKSWDRWRVLDGFITWAPESTFRWKALRVGKVGHLDGWPVGSTLALDGNPVSGRSFGGDRECQRRIRRPRMRATTPRRREPCFRAVLGPLDEGAAGDEAEASCAPSSASPSGVGLPQGGSTPHEPRSAGPWSGGSGRGGRRSSLRARKSNVPRVLVSKGRLQKSVRSIFSTNARGAERRTKRARSSPDGRPQP